MTLRVDSNGFYLYWKDQNNDTEFLDISSVRDARNGKGARSPRDAKLRDTCNLGAPEIPLEDKTLSIFHGSDFVNINCINFCCNSSEVAQEWAGLILKMAYNLMAVNGSAYMFMVKAHTRIGLMEDREGRIPVKNIVKVFAQHKDDRKRVEKALEEATGLPCGKTESLSPEVWTLDKFLKFAKQLVGRSELDDIFHRLCVRPLGGDEDEPPRTFRNLMSVDELVKFLNEEQRDPRLNEILHPYADKAKAIELINTYELNKENAAQGNLSIDGFLRYLMSDDNAAVAPEKFDLNLDMDQPLAHYYINSSHNTYLTGESRIDTFLRVRSQTALTPTRRPTVRRQEFGGHVSASAARGLPLHRARLLGWEDGRRGAHHHAWQGHVHGHPVQSKDASRQAGLRRGATKTNCAFRHFCTR